MIRVLNEADIVGLNYLTPPTWNYNYENFLQNFITEDYFHAFLMFHNEKIVGTGNAFLKGKVGWLANIIVDEKYRGQGFGYQISQFLVDFLFAKNCETQLLIATELGEAVYKKLGFKKISEYVCFDSEKDEEYTCPISIQKLNTEHLKSVCELDRLINDEDRSHLISKCFQNSLGYFNVDGKLKGAYLPDFGRGLVLAMNPEVGTELLKLKHSTKGNRTLIPVENQDGIAWMLEYGLKAGPKTSRMILGKVNKWNPQHIYSYASGYCG